MIDLNVIDQGQLMHQPVRIKFKTEFKEILNILLENPERILKPALGLLEIFLKISFIFTLINYPKLIFLRTSGRHHYILFSEEKKITIECVHNYQNNNVLLRYRTKKTTSMRPDPTNQPLYWFGQEFILLVKHL